MRRLRLRFPCGNCGDRQSKASARIREAGAVCKPWRSRVPLEVKRKFPTVLCDVVASNPARSMPGGSPQSRPYDQTGTC